MRARTLHAIDNSLKIITDLVDRNGAKDVIDAEFQDKDVDMGIESSIDAFEAALGGVAAPADVEHFGFEHGLFNFRDQQCRPGLLALEEYSVGQAVAENQDMQHAVRIARRGLNRRGCKDRGTKNREPRSVHDGTKSERHGVV